MVVGFENVNHEERSQRVGIRKPCFYGQRSDKEMDREMEEEREERLSKYSVIVCAIHALRACMDS